MNIIFLDIDGVLNNARYASILNRLYGGNGYGGHNRIHLSTRNIRWDLYNVVKLLTIMDRTHARVVISSTWRLSHSLNNFRDMFQLYGLHSNRVIGVTPDASKGGITDAHPNGYIRGDDINLYLQHNPVDNYVILDDCDDFYPTQNLVQTDDEYGLSDDNMRRAIDILNRGS